MSRVSSLEPITMGFWGQKMYPVPTWRPCIWNPWSLWMLFYLEKEYFADVAYLTILRRDNSKLFWKPSNLMAKVLITKRWNFETERGEYTKEEKAKRPWSQRLEWCSLRSTDAGATRSWMRQEMRSSLLSHQKRGFPDHTLMSDFWPPKLWDNKFIYF